MDRFDAMFDFFQLLPVCYAGYLCPTNSVTAA